MCRRNALDIWRPKKGQLMWSLSPKTLCGGIPLTTLAMSFGLPRLQMIRLHDLDRLPVRCILLLVQSMLRRNGRLLSSQTVSCNLVTFLQTAVLMIMSSRREARGSWSFLNKNRAFLSNGNENFRACGAIRDNIPINLIKLLYWRALLRMPNSRRRGARGNAILRIKCGSPKAL